MNNRDIVVLPENIETTMSEQVFEILRAAVNLARFEQIRRLTTLRERLHRKFPGLESAVEEALNAWADQVRRSA
jgi:hypothetical protein